VFELAFGNELGTIRVCNGTELELEDVANTVMLSPGVQQVERPVVGPYPRPQLLVHPNEARGPGLLFGSGGCLLEATI